MPEDRDRYIPGVPCWVDTAQPDAEAAVAFYEGVFGWEFEDRMPPDAPGNYFVARLRGQDVAAVGSQQGSKTNDEARHNNASTRRRRGRTARRGPARPARRPRRRRGRGRRPGPCRGAAEPDRRGGRVRRHRHPAVPIRHRLAVPVEPAQDAGALEQHVRGPGDSSDLLGARLKFDDEPQGLIGILQGVGEAAKAAVKVGVLARALAKMLASPGTSGCVRCRFRARSMASEKSAACCGEGRREQSPTRSGRHGAGPAGESGRPSAGPCTRSAHSTADLRACSSCPKLCCASPRTINAPPNRTR